MNGAGCYFEIAPGWVWIGGGIYMPETHELAAIREHSPSPVILLASGESSVLLDEAP